MSRRYGEVVAVDRLDLKIASGELVTLLGPSGSGQTTTVMVVAGFTLPSAGRVRIGDRDVTHVPTHRRDIGVVFQQYALFPQMSVAENVAFPLRMRGIGRAGRDDRAAFAHAIVFDPPALILDAPLGARQEAARGAPEQDQGPARAPRPDDGLPHP